MLTLLTPGGSIPLKVDDYYIRELSSGLDELVFSLSVWDEDYPLIQEESNIIEESDGQRCAYLVKAIDGGKSAATIKCQIDLDEWKSSFSIDYNSGSNTFQAIVNAIKPTGWTVVNNSGMVNARTIKLEAATPYDVLEQCRSTFKGATFRFDNVNKIITLVNMNNGQNLGAFVTRDLNLKENSYKGKSTGFATRLYAYGKDGLTFESINNGKPYIDDNTYSSRIVCAYWKDERYTVAQNLLDDARAKLAGMAVPQRSFDCSVVDLAKTNPGKYSELDFKLFSFVGLIDQTRSGAKIEHQVVELWRYPFYPEKNKVVLSTVAPRLQTQVTQIIQSITNANSEWNQQQNAMYNALTAAILGANGGSVRLLDTNGDGEPDTLYIADDPDPEQAQMVWRFNYQGWGASQNGYNGPFVLGATFENGGTINAENLIVNNINGQNIKDKTIGSNPIADSAVITRTISSGSVTGGSSGKIAGGTITTANTGSGINTSLGYADFSNDVFSGRSTANYCEANTLVVKNSATILGSGVGKYTATINGVTIPYFGWGAPY